MQYSSSPIYPELQDRKQQDDVAGCSFSETHYTQHSYVAFRLRCRTHMGLGTCGAVRCNAYTSGAVFFVEKRRFIANRVAVVDKGEKVKLLLK